MKKTALILILISFSSLLHAEKTDDGLYAYMDTSKGMIVIRLEYEKAPLTVMNFVGLAEGTLDNTFRPGKPYYDGLTFHRVVDNFVIQGGDPQGSGRGGPGYSFPDEFHPDLRHNTEGILSMANSGPNTNGSQFFITLSATSARHLDDKHAVFGLVTRGMDVVKKIKEGDAIKSVKIKRVGADAKAFICSNEKFKELSARVKASAGDREKARIAREREQAKTIIPDAEKTSSDIYYRIVEQGNGEQLKKGDTARLSYTGLLLNGTVIESTQGRGPMEIVYGKTVLLKGMAEMLAMMKPGARIQAVIPPEMAFGEQGYPGVIPGNSWVFYEIVLVEIK